MGPGTTLFTLIPRSANSLVAARVKRSSGVFAPAQVP